MLIVVSPAKTLDYESPLVTSRFTQPELLDHSAALITRARQLSPDQIASLMKISDKLAGLNAARFAEWQPDFTPANARQALLAFKGDVYTGLAVEDFSEADLDFAQAHLRMLSGLYGVLRPLDLMMPYRLEMGTRLPNPRGKDLYAYWGDRLAEQMRILATDPRNVPALLAAGELSARLNDPAAAAGFFARAQALAPGMQLEADVQLDRRRLIEWIFEPLLGVAGRV